MTNRTASMAQGASIRSRPFGRTDLTVSEFGLGCARIGGVFKQDSVNFVELLAKAFDAGITFFDTADMYSQGESEKLLGRAMQGRRDRIVIASKAGYVLPAQRRLIARIKPIVRPAIRLLGLSRKHLPSSVRGELAQDFSPAYLIKAVEGSLKRLSTDYIDLLQLHSPPVAAIATGDWIEPLEQLKRMGKIRHYGISCDSVDAARAALAHGGVSSLQLPINLLERDALQVLPLAVQQGVGVIARECLANGLLIKDVSTLDVSTYVRSEDEGTNKVARVKRYSQVAAESGMTLPQLALDFVASADGVSVSLVGVSTMPQLEFLLREGLPSFRLQRGAIPNFT